MTEKTEYPTPKKLKKARSKGDVPKSTELASALIFLGALFFLWSLGRSLETGFRKTFYTLFSSLNTAAPLDSLRDAFAPFVLPVILFFCGVFCVALAAHFFQTGWIWSWSRFRPKEKGSWIFILLKILVLALMGYGFFLKEKKQASYLYFMDVSQSAPVIYKKIFSILLQLALALVLIGIVDFFFQKRQYRKRMGMTRQEIKDEKKESEGNKKIKSKFHK